MKKLGFAACAAFALFATGASANGYWQDGIYYEYVTPSYGSTGTYTGTLNTVRPSGTVTYIQPSTATTTYSQPYYSAPVTTYNAPAPTYTSPSYIAPSPYYAPVVPAYAPPAYAPQYDGRDRVRARIRNQRDRIERALSRGDLRRGEERRLREGLREIRRAFRGYRDNDGVIGRWEEAELMRMLDRNSRRIRRLANNDRVAGNHGGHRGHYPY